MFQEVCALGQKVAISRQPPVEWHTGIGDDSGIYKIIDTHIENVSLPQVTDFLSQWSIKSGYPLLVRWSWLILISLHCFFTIVLFMSSVFVSEQSVSNRLLKDRLRSANASCSSSSGPPVLLCVWQEGKQAALAADFSVTQFKHLGRLLMVHGRNSYKRSAALSQFVIHRSLCISAMQVQLKHGAHCLFVCS